MHPGQKEKALATIGYIDGARPFGYGKPIRDDKNNVCIGQEFGPRMVLVSEAELKLAGQ
jgi:hypothetical protein